MTTQKVIEKYKDRGKKYMKKEGLIQDEPWRFISILTETRTYDFNLKRKDDAIDFISCINHQKNTKMIKLMLLKLKISRMATKKGLELH